MVLTEKSKKANKSDLDYVALDNAEGYSLRLNYASGGEQASLIELIRTMADD